MTIILACAPKPTLVPAPVSLDETHMRPVTGFLDSVVAAGAAPGAVLGILRGQERFVYSTGQLGADQPTSPSAETIYDLASLTKVVALVPAAMLAVEEGKLKLDAPVQRYVPPFSGEGKDRVTVRMLLAHASGLPAWRPLFREAQSRAKALAVVDTTPLDSAPGTAVVYSDLGTIVLTQVIEAIYHERLDTLVERKVFEPLGMTSTGYLPGLDREDRTAPTELDPWRGRVLRGEVHDENAAIMDGVSGHAGLFSSMRDLLTFAEWLLELADGRTGGRADGAIDRRAAGGGQQSNDLANGPTVRPSVLREFTRRQNLVPGSSRALGWDTPSEGSSAGHLLSRNSFGHTGFTGTSLWIDPEHSLAIVLLSNRVNPTRNNPRWNPIRAAVADLVMTTLFEDAR